MKRTTKKTSALILSLLIMLGSFAACSGQTPSEVSDPASQSTVQSAEDSAPVEDSPAQTLDEVTLRLYFPDMKRAMFDEVWNSVSELTKDRLNAKFEVNFVGWDDYANKLQMLTASGDKFDGFFDANWLTYNQMVTKGALLDITELLPQYAPEYYKQLEAIDSINPILVGGRLYTMPWTMPKAERTYFIYRTDLAEKYGVDLSNATTHEELEPYLDAIKKNEPELMATYWDRGSGANFMSHVIKGYMVKYGYDMVGDGFVYKLDDPTCQITPFEQTDAFREAMLLIKKWYDAEYFPKNMMSITWQEDPFQTGKSASLWDSSGSAFNNYPFQNIPGADNAGVAMYPDQLAPLASPLNNLYSINKNAENPERLMMFIELLSTDREVYDRVMYGIEGTTYVLDGEKAVFPEGMDGGSSTYLDWSGQWPLWRAVFSRPTDQNDEESIRKNAETCADPKNVGGKLSSFTPVTDPIKVELAKRDSIADEEMRILEFGVAPDVEKAIANYIEHQKAAGVDLIVAEMQKQIDEFIAAN